LAVVEGAVVAAAVVEAVLPSFFARGAAVPLCGAFAGFDEGDDGDEDEDEDEDDELRR
jgi:hypothetical protein